MKASKIAYKRVGLALGVVGGMAAGAVFKQTWKPLGHDEDTPEATDAGRNWGEVLLAATLQGATFAAEVGRADSRWAARRPAGRGEENTAVVIFSCG
ncbi:DUF4235 domain-containing protein [Streptomyces sp. ISL-22]|uniref:DUF4235 domain-containing protein n=1 Tax=unclassified Streptomyces TaxID=2593676 RepID=UPI001BEA481A|nr:MULTISPECIES: DUF4235 domain-containing protein [unclassified Streptomyces]MBT2423590.1 DUF4235 domain-containing protein [Streptomyces sp. ISL-24]MBT2438254.1 DUF4235 domain-containing protein [Streptomyces sp. ISL-22]